MLELLARIIKDTEFSGKDICLAKGIDIYYNKRSHNFSSTELRKRIQQAEDEKQIKSN
jgi:glycerol-3-phosphate cytidylyltransferase